MNTTTRHAWLGALLSCALFASAASHAMEEKRQTAKMVPEGKLQKQHLFDGDFIKRHLTWVMPLNPDGSVANAVKDLYRVRALKAKGAKQFSVIVATEQNIEKLTTGLVAVQAQSDGKTKTFYHTATPVDVYELSAGKDGPNCVLETKVVWLAKEDGGKQRICHYVHEDQKTKWGLESDDTEGCSDH